MSAGRPPIHTDPNEVDRLIEDYFEWIKGEGEDRFRSVKNKDGDLVDQLYWHWIREPEPPTVTGLALHLGFCDKKSLYDYAAKPEFLHSIKKGLSKIEQAHEKALFGDKCTGNIFALKNMGWDDKRNVDVTSGNMPISMGPVVLPLLMETYEEEE